MVHGDQWNFREWHLTDLGKKYMLEQSVIKKAKR
jgi:hypothetical protein